jgi:hypothetical protein
MAQMTRPILIAAAIRMRCVSKIIAVTVALGLVALLNTGALLHAQDSDSNKYVCLNALNIEQTAWDQASNFSKWVAEATRRGLTIDACRQLIPPTRNLPANPDSGGSAAAQSLWKVREPLRDAARLVAEAAAYESLLKTCEKLHPREPSFSVAKEAMGNIVRRRGNVFTADEKKEISTTAEQAAEKASIHITMNTNANAFSECSQLLRGVRTSIENGHFEQFK